MTIAFITVSKKKKKKMIKDEKELYSVFLWEAEDSSSNHAQPFCIPLHPPPFYNCFLRLQSENQYPEAFQSLVQKSRMKHPISPRRVSKCIVRLG